MKPIPLLWRLRLTPLLRTAMAAKPETRAFTRQMYAGKHDCSFSYCTGCPFLMIDNPSLCHMNANIHSMNYSLDDRGALAQSLLHPIRGDFQ